MNTENINWDEVPDTLSLEQIRKLIHVSKRAAKTLLDTEIPCIQKKRTTHKYYVDKQDLIDYLGTHYQISSTKKRSCNSRLFTSDIPEYFKGELSRYEILLLTSSTITRFIILLYITISFFFLHPKRNTIYGIVFLSLNQPITY